MNIHKIQIRSMFETSDDLIACLSASYQFRISKALVD